MSKRNRIPDKAKYLDLIMKFNGIYPDMKAWPLAVLMMKVEDIPVTTHSLRRWICEYREEQSTYENLIEDSTDMLPVWVNDDEKTIRDFSQSEPTLFKVQGGVSSRTEEEGKEIIRKGCEEYYGSNNLHTFPCSIPSSEDVESGAADEAHKTWIPVSGLNNNERTYVVMGCLHMPFHNRNMFDAAINLMKDLRAYGKLSGVILNGDILDMHSISRHGKDKVGVPGWDLEREYRVASLELDKIDRAAGPCEKVYMYGNHEMWYFDFMSDPRNFKLGQGVVQSPEVGLGLRERGYKVQRDYRTAFHMLGDLEVIHGDYVNVHAAHAHVQKMKRNVMFAHTHRMGSYMEGNLMGYNIGWGGDSTAPVFGYMTRVMKETWRNGFAVVTVDAQNHAHVTQIVWTNDSFFYGGKRYTA